MIVERIQLRPNYYPDGPYLNSPCIHCGLLLKHTGAWSGTTWVPVDPGDSPHPDTCYSNEVQRSTFGQHEPWEAVPQARKEAT